MFLSNHGPDPRTTCQLCGGRIVWDEDGNDWCPCLDTEAGQ